MIVGTSKGPIESWLTAPPPIFPPVPLSRYSGGGLGWGPSASAGLADIAAIVARETGLSPSRRLTLSAACASGLHALIRAAMMIQSGEVSRALVVAAESSAPSAVSLQLQKLGVLCPPGFFCRPFDVDRRGFLVSDSAAAICLERSTSDSPVWPASTVSPWPAMQPI